MLADTFKKAKFSIKNLAGTYVLAALQTKLSSVVDSPVKSLTRSTAYAVKTVISVETMPEPGFLICTTAGTTAVAEPNYAALIEGQEITDGTAKFKAYFYSNMIATMVGATSLLAGAKGIVPAPAAGDERKYLKGNGLWEAILIASQAEAEAGTENTKTMTALRVAQAFAQMAKWKPTTNAGIGQFRDLVWDFTNHKVLLPPDGTWAYCFIYTVCWSGGDAVSERSSNHGTGIAAGGTELAANQYIQAQSGGNGLEGYGGFCWRIA